MAVRYLALGDSYTIGTGATDDSHNYPSILAAKLAAAAATAVDVTNPAVNGYTTDDLIAHELPLLKTVRPQLVTILIGVNDIVQGRTPERYRANLARIYDAVGALELGAGRVVCISIPDWADMPAARPFGAAGHLRERTAAFNAIAHEEAGRRGFGWVDITEASLSGAGSTGWIASDDLHPGDTQYAVWADVIWEAVAGDWTTAAD